MQLWILRHAHASGSSGSGRDIDRPLSARGQAQARALNARLRSDSIPRGCQVRISPAARARQTAVLVLADLELGDPLVDPRIWEASAGDLLEVIRDGMTAGGDVMLIGHNPGLEGLARWLTGDPIGLKPASLVALEVDSRLLPGSARILFQHHPG